MFDFAKNLTVADIATVPENYRGLYAEVEENGTKVFRISDTAKGIVEAYIGTNDALAKSRGDLSKANAESASRRVTKQGVLELLKSFGAEGVSEDDPLESLKAHLEGLVSQVKNGKDIKINFDKIKADHARALSEAVATKDVENAKMKGALERYLVDQAATAALAAAKGSIQLLLPHVKEHAKVVQDGEDFVVRVVDQQGDFRVDGKGGFMSVADLVTEMKTQEGFNRAFESEAAPGSGAKPGSQNRVVTQRAEDSMSATDKISRGLQKGQYKKNHP